MDLLQFPDIQKLPFSRLRIRLPSSVIRHYLVRRFPCFLYNYREILHLGMLPNSFRHHFFCRKPEMFVGKENPKKCNLHWMCWLESFIAVSATKIVTTFWPGGSFIWICCNCRTFGNFHNLLFFTTSQDCFAKFCGPNVSIVSFFTVNLNLFWTNFFSLKDLPQLAELV